MQGTIDVVLGIVAHTSGVVEDAALNVVATLAHTAVDNPKNDTVLPLGLIRKRGAWASIILRVLVHEVNALLLHVQPVQVGRGAGITLVGEDLLPISITAIYLRPLLLLHITRKLY